ncbi:hypothetical protein ACIA47_09975 [Micromonospora sp. NPDC051227]|uniref:hypothetical protein n=1 Tax=Micromonospora sp. NPDC051227 TaxID=3364285 RepID=UPI0037A58FC4
MPPLPQPDDLASLVLRTDFTDDSAWEAVKEEFRRWECCYSATFVDAADESGTYRGFEGN